MVVVVLPGGCGLWVVCGSVSPWLSFVRFAMKLAAAAWMIAWGCARRTPNGPGGP